MKIRRSPKTKTCKNGFEYEPLIIEINGKTYEQTAKGAFYEHATYFAVGMAAMFAMGSAESIADLLMK